MTSIRTAREIRCSRLNTLCHDPSRSCFTSADSSIFVSVPTSVAVGCCRVNALIFSMVIIVSPFMVCLLIVVTRVLGLSSILTGKSNVFGKNTKNPRRFFRGSVGCDWLLVMASLLLPTAYSAFANPAFCGESVVERLFCRLDCEDNCLRRFGVLAVDLHQVVDVPSQGLFKGMYRSHRFAVDSSCCHHCFAFRGSSLPGQGGKKS